MPEPLLIASLAGILGLVLVLPFAVRRVEEEIEAFLLVMGLLAVTASGLWSRHLVAESLREPVKISAAVLVFGCLFRASRGLIQWHVAGLARRAGRGPFLFGVVVALGVLSSVITAIVASLVLVEVISGLRLAKDRERAVVVCACYGIGLGAVLTPLGEPLATLATARLAGPPHQADFFFLARLLWPWVAAGILAAGLLASRCAGPDVSQEESLASSQDETVGAIVVRAAKVYAFVAALVLLGQGFSPVVDRCLVALPSWALYWINLVSAVLDNATLAAAEISPEMSAGHIQFLLMGLLISGGMLIPGNIPNIICASKLGIQSKEWARVGVPVGLALMAVYFVWLWASVRGA